MVAGKGVQFLGLAARLLRVVSTAKTDDNRICRSAGYSNTASALHRTQQGEFIRMLKSAASG